MYIIWNYLNSVIEINIGLEFVYLLITDWNCYYKRILISFMNDRTMILVLAPSNLLNTITGIQLMFKKILLITYLYSIY